MDVQMHSGVGDLRCFFGLLEHLTVVAGFRMCGNIFPHAQPTIIFLKFLHLVSDGYVWMTLPEVADHRLPIFERQIEGFERGDIGATAWTVDPDGAMVVHQQVAIEIVELEFVVRM